MATKEIKAGDPVLTGGLAALTAPTVIPPEASRMDRIGIVADKYSPYNIVGGALDALTLGTEDIFDYLLSPDPYGEKEAADIAADAARRKQIEQQIADRDAQRNIINPMTTGFGPPSGIISDSTDVTGVSSEVRGSPDFPEGDPSQRAPTGEGTDAVEAATTAGVSPKGVAGADTPVRKATVTALDEYLRNARPGVKPENYKEYMKEFADATGLDVSGEPDNRAALMAFGLALMQNKAGKGFDVGAMLSSVGEAGEKALPSLQKARENAKAIRAKAGEYALGRKKEDEAAAMNRQEYLVIPKGDKGGPLGVVDAILEGKGQNVRLNAFELRNLDENEDFASQYEIVTVSDYQDILKEALKTPEVQDLYQSGSSNVSLFTGAPKGVGLTVQLPDLNNPNAQGKKPGVLAGGPESLAYIRKMEKGLATGRGFFREIAGLLAQTDISVPSQARSAIVQTLRNLGLSTGGETDPVKQIQVMLTELKAKNAAEILGESGKTLSDNDRRMVSEIVGEISFTEGDEALLIQKLNRLYESVIGGREADLAEAYNTLNTYGISYGSDTTNNILGVTEDEQGTLYDATVD